MELYQLYIKISKFLLLYRHLQHHNDTIIKTSLTKYLPLTLLQGFEKVIQGFRVRGSWRPNRTEIFWPPLLWPSTLCLSRSPDAQLEALGSTLLGAGFLYCILSATSLVPKLHRVPEGPLGRMWFYLPQFVLSVSNSTATGTQLFCRDFCLDWVI